MKVLTDSGLATFWNKIKNYVSGNVYNPDNEDISSYTSSGSKILRLADRTYDASTFCGKGYKILRKNIKAVNNVKKNVLEQSMINSANTIYEIRYDFDLNGKTIELPENCVLKFYGGILRNGTVKGNHTAIESSIYQIFDIDISGTFSVDKAYPQWFGTISAEKDCTNEIQKCLNSFGKATIIEDMKCKGLTINNCLLEGIDKGMVYNHGGNRPKLISIDDYNIIDSIISSNVTGISFVGLNAKKAIDSCVDSRFKNCTFSKFSSAIGSTLNYTRMCIIENCDFNNNDCAIFNMIDSRVVNCMFNSNNIAIKLYTGANANIITNNRIEWSNTIAIDLYKCSFNSITCNQFDRQGEEAIKVVGCSFTQVTNNSFNRSGANKTSYKTKCHLFLQETSNIFISGNIFNVGATQDGGSDAVPSNIFYIENCTVTASNNNMEKGFTDSVAASYNGYLISNNNTGIKDTIKEEYSELIDSKIQEVKHIVLIREEGSLIPSTPKEIKVPLTNLTEYSHSRLMECIISCRNDAGNCYVVKIPFIVTNEGSINVKFGDKTKIFSQTETVNLSFVSYNENILKLQISNITSNNFSYRLSILYY